MAEGDCADQGQSESSAVGTAPGRPGPESLEDVIDLRRLDALTGILDDEAGGRGLVVAGHREPDRVAHAGVLDGVLQQGIQGQLEALPVGGHGHRVQLAGRPDPAGGGVPALQRVDEEAVQRDRGQEQKFGILGHGDQQQPLAQAFQPGQLAHHHVDVLLLAAAVQLGGQQLGVAQRDGDRGPQLVRGVLEKGALVGQQPAGLFGGPERGSGPIPAQAGIPHRAPS